MFRRWFIAAFAVACVVTPSGAWNADAGDQSVRATGGFGCC